MKEIIWYGEKQDLQKSKNKTLNEFINIDSDTRIKNLMIFSNIKIIDLISLLVILLSVLASTWRGFIKESLTVIIWIIAYFLSNALFLNVFKYTNSFVQIELLAYLISWIIPFIVFVIFLSILNRILIYPLVLKYSNFIDHFLGSFFGLIRGFLLIYLIFIFTIYLIEDINKFPLNIKNSYTVELSNSLSKIISPIIPYEIFNNEKNSIGL